jgi:hypothetical protein
VLVVGLVAAPIVLSKGSSDTTPPPAPAPTKADNGSQGGKTADELAKVTLDEQDEGTGSSLSAFEAQDPFKPPSGVKVGNQTAQPDGGTGAAAPTGSTGTTGTTPSTGGGSGGGTTGGTEGGSGGGTGGGSEPKTTEFTYVLDVTFWNNGHKRTIKGMQKLDVLPNRINPLLIFMGVSSGGGNGVFLVDATLQTTGEGKCRPNQGNCAFLYLGAGAEQEFTNEDGDSYRLRIDQIRKVKVGEEKATASSKKSKSARAAVEGSPAPHRFVPPVLADFVEQTGDDSTGDEDRR